MQTDPQHLKWKTDNDLKTAIISTILGQLVQLPTGFKLHRMFVSSTYMYD